jgi:rhodanese-related sulfurtransferase
MNTQRPLSGALIIVIVGAGLGIGYNVLHPKSIPWKGEAKKTVTLETADGPVTLDPPPEREEREHKLDPPRTEMVPDEQPTSTPEGEDQQMAPSGGDAPPRTAPVESTPPPPGRGENQQMTPATPDPPKDLYADIPESEYPIEISTTQAKDLYDRGGLLILDARELEEYSGGHIKGAQAAPSDEMVGNIDWLDRTSSDPRPILVYCDGGDCELSLNLGFELSQSGHRKVLVYKDGFDAWTEAGHPVSTGEAP